LHWKSLTTERSLYLQNTQRSKHRTARQIGNRVVQTAKESMSYCQILGARRVT